MGEVENIERQLLTSRKLGFILTNHVRILMRTAWHTRYTRPTWKVDSMGRRGGVHTKTRRHNAILTGTPGHRLNRQCLESRVRDTPHSVAAPQYLIIRL